MSERRKVNFIIADGFPFDQNTFDHLQTSIRQIQLLGHLGTQEGAYILSGCEITGDDAADGWIWFEGELVPLQGGEIKEFIQIHLADTTELFNNGVTTSSENKYTDEHFEFVDAIGIGAGLGTGLTWEDIKRLPRLDELYSLDEWHEVGAVGEPAYVGDFIHVDNTLEFIKENCLLEGSLGRVSFKGYLLPGGATVNDADLIFTLPALYRPNTNQFFVVANDHNELFSIKIETDGKVIWYGDNHTFTYGVYFSGVNFIAWQ